ncbi:hypothetical protein BJY04DRAFT_213708 [Aspergillus karnatakaensis]|uniref:uncharacterized protein n=1 Tax=Aspergillus karnatakaensis TaxID=1810916 RepID=UPI003CCDCCEA
MRPKKRLQHQSYTVGWICAVALEMAAAKAMLDRRHEQLRQSTRDANKYVLGEVFGTNIVIACLPSGQYGTNAAATVSAQMWATFPSLQFALIVGVGAGVPTSGVDIRLGDVVVSKPTGTYGGVVQYDHGKTMANGRFMHTGSLNRPPQKLLTAVADLESNHMMGTNRLSEFLLEVKTRYPKMSNFFHPTGPDYLFQADYDHEKEGVPCEQCDPARLIVRDSRPSEGPRIHYGLIASASQVMKDASTRDRLAKEHGIICFEMEAAGVMNNLPCLVIRGICDYADSHKNKGWQCYAALIAAAYAKELMGLIHDDNRTAEAGTLPDAFDSRELHDESRFILLSQTPEWQIIHHDSKRHYNIFDRLSSYDPFRTCRNYLDRKCPSTASWLVQNITFNEWQLKTGPPCLWLTGKIGCGKSFITSAVIQLLEASQQETSSIVAHFFYSHSDRTRLKAIDVFESYTKQIVGHLARLDIDIPESVVNRVKQLYGPGRWPSSLTEMVEAVFFPVCRLVPDAIFIVDGVDECERAQAIQILEVFRKMAVENHSRVLISGREGLDVSQAISESTTIFIANHGNGSDILRFIDWKMEEKLRHRTLTENQQLLLKIRRRLAERADQMFLWVSLQLEVLWGECFTDRDIEECLDNLPKDLSETYMRCIDRIDQKRSSLAYKILFWVCVAVTPFTMSQMQEALAIDVKTGLVDPRNTMPKKELLRLCSHLVIQTTDGKLRLTHYSVSQFMAQGTERGEHTWSDQTLPTAKEELGQLCVVHLQSGLYSRAIERYRDLTDGRGVIDTLQKHVPYAKLFGKIVSRSTPLQIHWPPRLPSTVTTMERPKFFGFACSNWASLLETIDDSSTFWGRFKAIALNNSFSERVHPWDIIGDSLESHLVGMLAWAIANKHTPLFSLLGDPDFPSIRKEVFNIPLYYYDNMPLLHLAAKMNFIPAIQKLLQHSKPGLLDHKKRLLIHHAAGSGSTEAMNIVIQSRQAHINAQDIDGRSPLHFAALNNSHDVVKILLDFPGIDADIPDVFGKTPLFYAIEVGNNTVVKALIHDGAYPEHKDAKGQTPAFIAAARLNADALKLVLPYKLDKDAVDNYGHTALQMAVASVLRLDTHQIAEGQVETALIKAIRCNNEPALKALLLLGANPNAEIHATDVPIMAAMRVGNCSFVNMLVEAGATVNAYYPSLLRSPLSLAIHLGRTDFVEVLTRGGIVFDYKLFAEAARLGHSDIVRLLVGESLRTPWTLPSDPLNPFDSPFNLQPATTAITLACCYNHPAVVDILANRYRCFRPDTIVSTLIDYDQFLANLILQEIDQTDDDIYQLLLAIAAACDSVQVVEKLLATVAIPDSRALIIVISMKSAGAAYMLIENGTPVGPQVLNDASENGLDGVVTRLVEFGAQLEQITFDSPERGCAAKTTEPRRRYDLSGTKIFYQH